MISRMVRKTVRLTAAEEYKLKKMSEISGLTESDILRLFFYNITVIREKPSKELINSLNKINNIGNNINQIAKHANTFDEIEFDTLKVYLTNLNSLVNEVRNKYL